MKFYNRITRTVRKDSTIHIDKIQYDIPTTLSAKKVTVYYLPDYMDHAFIFFGDKHYELRRTNKVENAHTRRKNLPALDYNKIAEDKKSDPEAVQDKNASEGAVTGAAGGNR